MLAVETTYESESLAITDVRCTAASGPGGAEAVHELQIMMPRRGVFRRRTTTGTATIDCATAVLGLPGEGQVVDHPEPGGDRCTAITLRSESWWDAAPLTSNAHATGRRVAELHRGIVAAVGTASDPIGLEELTLQILDAITGGIGRLRKAAPHHRALADDTRLLLDMRFGERWRLADVGRAVGASPHHLARVFRAVNGSSIHEHLVEIRLQEAASRLEDGADDIAAVAHDCGFFDHSHLTGTFRRRLGVTPSALRRGRRSDE